VVVTRPTAIPHLTNVTVVLITTRVRGLPTEVELGAAHGLLEGSVANCDNVLTVSKTAITALRGVLGPAEMRALDDALRMALALD
jgi:mRNA interferase MazF